MQVSFYKGSTDTVGVVVDHLIVLEAIKAGKWCNDIQALRSSLKDGRVDEYKESKKSLPAVTFSGTFTERKDECISYGSGLIVIDIDGLSDEQLFTYRNAFDKDEFIYSFFVSPSQKGIKILIKYSLPSQTEYSKELGNLFLRCFIALEKYFLETYAVVIDPSGKNISRLCYISHDPDLYLNESSSIFTFPEDYIAPVVTVHKFDDRPEQFKGYVLSKDAKYAFAVCEKWTQRNHKFEEGDRNNYIYVLGCNLNRAGVEYMDASLMIFNNYSELGFKELDTTVKSAYKRINEFNSIDIYNIPENDLPNHKEDYTEGMTMEEETIFNDTISLLNANINKKLVNKLIKVLGVSYLSVDEDKVSEIMNKALLSLESAGETLLHKSAEDTMLDVIDNFSSVEGISTLVPEINDALGGGLMPGSLHGFIGDGGTYKSVLSQCIASNAAKDNSIALYLNGEMSGMQLIDRVLNKELKIEFLSGIREKKINKSDIPKLTEELNAVLKGNLEIVNGKGWSREEIKNTVKEIEKKKGKKVNLIIVDGISQMEDKKNDEIKSAIFNSGELKEIAKETNTAIIALLHCSGGVSKHVRDTSRFVRGGSKVTNNMDDYFCFSLCIDKDESDIENNDIMYLPQMLYLRFIDKRGTGIIINKILHIKRPMDVIVDDREAESMEIKS